VNTAPQSDSIGLKPRPMVTNPVRLYKLGVRSTVFLSTSWPGRVDVEP
jgi:hypothetical protein